MKRLTELNGRFFWDGQEVTREQARRLYDSEPTTEEREQALPGASALPYEPGGNVAVGAKNVALNAWDNLRQMVSPDDEAAQIQQQMDIRNEQFQNLQQTDMGRGTGVGQALGYAVPAALTRGIGSEALIGGASAYMGTNNPTWLDAALGSATAAGGRLLADQVIGRVVNAVRGVKPIETPAAAGREAGGYWQSPAQMKGDQTGLQGTEVRGITNPYVKYPKRQGEANLARLTERLNESMGNPPDAGVLNRELRTETGKRLGKELDAAVAGAPDMPLSDDLIAQLDELKAEKWTKLDYPKTGVVDGPDYKTLRQTLRAARDRTSDGDKKGFIGDAIRQLDEEFEKVVPTEQVKAYRTAREHYKNLSMAEEGRALSGAGEINLETMQGKFASDRGYGSRDISKTLPETRNLINDMESLVGRENMAYLGSPRTGEATRGWFNPSNILEAPAYQAYFRYPGLMSARDPLFGSAGGAAGMGAGGLLQPPEDWVIGQ